MGEFGSIVAYLFIGVLLRRSGRMPDGFSSALNTFVIYISLPALVLLKVPGMELGQDLLFVALLPWLMVAVSAAAVMAASRALSWNREVTGCLLLMACLGNTSFLGIPMVRAFFGEDAVGYAMIYDQLGSFLALSTYGSLVLALFGKEAGARPDPGDVLRKIVTFPPFLALVAALVLHGIPQPAVVRGMLASLGGTLVPLVMVAVGYQLTPHMEPGATVPLAVGLARKMILAPLAATGVAWAFGLHGRGVDVAVFEAGMPPMVSAGALAIMAGLSPRLTAALVGVGIFCSFATLPVLHSLLG